MSRSIVIKALVPLALLAAFFGWKALAPDGTKLTADFDAAVGLYPGSDVQVLGVPVGEVTAVEPEGQGVKVSMELDPDVAVAADTNAVIVAPTLVSDRFVQLTKPLEGGAALSDGAHLASERTAVPVEIDELYDSLTDVATQLGPEGVNENGALSKFLEVTAKNLDGNGADINQLISEFGDASATLADSGDDLFATFANLKDFNDMLVANDRGLAQVNGQLAEVSDYLADDSDDLAAAIDNLGSALAILDDFVKDNRGQLTTSVENLIGPTQVLVKQKASLEESVRLAPLVLQNFIRAYDPATNTIGGRGNLNEVSIWQNQQTGQGSAPNLLPGVE